MEQKISENKILNDKTSENRISEGRVVMTDPKKADSFYEESIKTLRTNLQFTGRGIRVIMISSCYPNEGKSDIIFQLAREIGNMGKRVLLLDADIRKSAFISRYQVRKKNIYGLSHYLCGQAEIDKIRYQTNFPGLDVIFAGPSVPNPSELLEDFAFESLIQKMRGEYDYILIDTPPIVSVSDALIVAKYCNGVILVVESKLVSYKVLQKVKKQLAQTGCRVLGAVLNKVDLEEDKYYSRYGYYKYYSKYEYKKENSGQGQ